jgi:hypothetical protein
LPKTPPCPVFFTSVEKLKICSVVFCAGMNNARGLAGDKKTRQLALIVLAAE